MSGSSLPLLEDSAALSPSPCIRMAAAPPEASVRPLLAVRLNPPGLMMIPLGTSHPLVEGHEVALLLAWIVVLAAMRMSLTRPSLSASPKPCGACGACSSSTSSRGEKLRPHRPRDAPLAGTQMTRAPLRLHMKPASPLGPAAAAHRPPQSRLQLLATM